MRHYADRGPQDLEPHFFNHMLAMTSEGLHDKADIALELAYRDKKIATMQAEIDAKNEFIQATRPELAKKIATLQAEIDGLVKSLEHWMMIGRSEHNQTTKRWKADKALIKKHRSR